MAKAFPDNPVWTVPRASPDACGMGRLLAARSDSAVVLVPGRRGVAIFAGSRGRARAELRGAGRCTRSGGPILLVCLGVFLRSTSSQQTNFTFEDTLSQIGMGYFFLFLLGLPRPRWQWLAFVVILVGYWAAFARLHAAARP